ncbi:glyoxalase [Rhizocola hellebori]|uniref:Glyoxalase n=2 Tax=Rhizocola hellebori TaxID=1392758 RepID=A0A8J3QAS5_9ACTN|nr:glyoxalase [Rhizocola hellebori]
MAVADMGKALAFYRLMGLDLPPGAEKEDHVESTLPGGIRIAWDLISMVRTFDPEWTEPTGSPRISLAFLCGSPAEVDRLYAEVVAAGYRGHKEPWDAFWGQRYATIVDPDGNGVDLFCPLTPPAS